MLVVSQTGREILFYFAKCMSFKFSSLLLFVMIAVYLHYEFYCNYLAWSLRAGALFRRRMQNLSKNLQRWLLSCYQCIKLILSQSREINGCVSVWAERKKPKWFCVWFTLNTVLTSVVKLWEETVSNVLHSLAYFQITCFDPQQLKCCAHSVTSFCLSQDSAHVEGSSRCL